MFLKRLSDAKITKLSDICSDMGVVALASVAIPAVLDRFRPMIAAGGVIVGGTLLILSVILIPKKYE